MYFATGLSKENAKEPYIIRYIPNNHAKNQNFRIRVYEMSSQMDAETNR